MAKKPSAPKAGKKRDPVGSFNFGANRKPGKKRKPKGGGS
jgi:hypothetical protein